jgi:hypothetical protein
MKGDALMRFMGIERVLNDNQRARGFLRRRAIVGGGTA